MALEESGPLGCWASGGADVPLATCNRTPHAPTPHCVEPASPDRLDPRPCPASLLRLLPPHAPLGQPVPARLPRPPPEHQVPGSLAASVPDAAPTDPVRPPAVPIADCPPDRGRPPWWQLVRLQRTGPVVRQAVAIQDDRDPDSEREKRRRENATCTAGLRSPAALLSRRPELTSSTRGLARTLMHLRASTPELQGLHLAGGAQPRRPPPSAASVSRARATIATALGLDPTSAELHHPAAPWRHQLVKAVLTLMNDADLEVARWLQFGAPMGLTSFIEPGGHFPLQTAKPTRHPASLQPLHKVDINHGSFGTQHPGEPEPAGLALVRRSVNDGFGEIFASRATAEEVLGAPVLPAPLGTVTKARQDGTLKHRLIQDLRANTVNSAVTLPERLVLPRPVDLAADLAELHAGRSMGDHLAVGIVDFEDAFMSVPLCSSERRFNCAEVPQGLRRSRPPLHPREPVSGQLVAWRVLGFGGRPNPLVFGRVTSVLMRLGQAILTTRSDHAAAGGAALSSSSYLNGRSRLQLYVDDAAGAFAGPPPDIEQSFDVLLLLWLVLGAPIAWPKVSLNWVDTGGPLRWIGVDFDMSGSCARLRLPPAFLRELSEQVRDLVGREGHISDEETDQLVGRAARVAYVVPAAVPFAAALRTALADSRRTQAERRRREQRGLHAVRRFATAAAWFCALLDGHRIRPDEPLRLERLVRAGGPQVLIPGACPAVIFDASPWGGGAVLYAGTHPTEIMVVDWSDALCSELGAERGSSACLSFFEALMALIALYTWCGAGGHRHVALIGDNLAALTTAVSLRGKGDLGRVCREIALLQGRLGLELAVGHLPSDDNVEADALSRQSGPSPPPVPQQLRGLPQRPMPELSDLFRLETPAAFRGV